MGGESMDNQEAMSSLTFDDIVADAIDALPAEFQERLDNVEVVVDEWPSAAALQQAGVASAAGLLGLYQGVPQTRRTHSYSLVPPDKITLFRQPILLRCQSVEQARRLVFHVLAHEIAHHFGISDDRLRAIGAY